MKTFLAICVLAVSTAAVADPMILSPENGRVWQTVFKPSEPIEWRWEDGAVSASVTVKDLISGEMRAAVPVARGAGNYGSFAVAGLTVPADGGESLADITLVQFGEGDAELSTQTARLAYLPGANGGAFTVAKFNPARVTVKEMRAVAYDAAWGTAAAGAATSTFTPQAGDPVVTELPGRGGYYPVAAEVGKLELAFGGVTLFETWLRNGGLMLIFR